MIIGCPGAGKSTLANRLGAITDLPVIHLDQQYWHPNWIESDATEWHATVRQLAAQPTWIIDGNYGSTMNLRLQHADTVIFLDYPTLTCLYRITKRIWTYHGEERPDMPPGCRERFSLDFYHYVLIFNLIRRKKILQRLEDHSITRSIFIFTKDREVETFLQEISHR